MIMVVDGEVEYNVLVFRTKFRGILQPTSGLGFREVFDPGVAPPAIHLEPFQGSWGSSGQFGVAMAFHWVIEGIRWWCFGSYLTSPMIPIRRENYS
jgi:hypothetical protein